MATINAGLRWLFDLLLKPLGALPPGVGLLLVSVLVGVAMLWVYKKTSDQKKIERVKNLIFANVFEIRLFNDSLPAIFRAQGEIFRRIPSYLRLSLVPLLWMLVPLTLLIAQLQFHWGYEGLKPGQSVLLKADLKDGASVPKDAKGVPQVTLQAPAGIAVEAGPVWVAAERQLAWRISAERAGRYELTFQAGSETLTKTAVSSEIAERRSPLRVGTGFLDQLLYPAEPPIPATSAFAQVSLGYPDAEVDVFGWKTNWLIGFLVLSLVAAFALRKPMGVEL